MKNSHFKILTLIAFATIFLSGCGTTTQQAAQTPAQTVAPTENTTNVQNSAPTATPVTLSTTPKIQVVAPPSVTPKKVTLTYDLSAVAKHNNANDCWVTINGKIYNVTAYIPQHPGGPEKIIRNCGKDGTQIFDLKHSPDKKQYLTPYFVANLQ